MVCGINAPSHYLNQRGGGGGGGGGGEGDYPTVLRTSKNRLRTYTGEMIQIQGIADVTVQDKNGKSRIWNWPESSGSQLA